MPSILGHLVASLVSGLIVQTSAPAAPLPCREWRDCQQLALEAAERREYERFHDLAWRAVQSGPSGQPDLMWLLARAQALSGRPHDALVMIRRLAELGVAVDASGDEFERTRGLRDWPAVEAMLTRRRPTAASSAAPTVTAPVTAPRAAVVPPRSPTRADQPPTVASPQPPSATATTAAAAARVLPLRPAARSDAARFTAPHIQVGGLAYDTVSQRFVIGDASERKLLVVGVGGTTPTDMVRAESAGFEDVAAVAIDQTRGDLWVAGAAGAVHRLQLVSGRPLRTYHPSPADGAVRLVDLAIGPSGTVVALDAVGNRLLSLGRGASELRATMELGVSGVTSLALEDEGTALVAHAGGIVRADLRSHTTAPVTAIEGIDLRDIDQLRAHRATLVGLQRTLDGTARVVRFELNGRRRVTAAAIIDDDGPAPTGRAFLAVSGDDLYYLSAAPQDNAPDNTPFIVRRLMLP